MRRLRYSVPFLILLHPSSPFLSAQNPAPPGAIRIDVNLVQVDAVVTDSHGRHVPDLEASDFELLQDGRKREITNFSYVAPKQPVSQRVTAQVKPQKGELPPPPQVFAPTDVRRELALVVDDQGLAAENIPRVRSAIKKFIDNDMQPGDLVAIVRTSAGMGALQQFTTDKRLLYAALERVKYGESRVGVSSFEPLGGPRGGRGTASLNHFREDDLSEGSLGAIRFVVNAMAGFPGRKSVVLFTENVRLMFRGMPDEMVAQAVQQLSDAAERASVVIHAIDPRGMPDFNLSAADDTSRVSPRRAARVPAQRQQQEVQTQEGMFVLARETGGLFLHDAGSTDLPGALKQAADDSEGYYLLGYHPEAGTFDSQNGGPRFHKIEVRVHRPGLAVRSRQGFWAAPETANQSPEQSRATELNRAFASPYSGAMHPRVTAIFANRAQIGSMVTAFVYLDPRELKWSNEADGSHGAAVDLAAAAFDDDGRALAAVDTTFPLRLTGPQYDEALKKGLVCGQVIPIAKPGPYLVRAAVRDPATENAGSAEQFIEVPDVGNGRLVLSGLVMRDAGVPIEAATPKTSALGADFTGGAARRSFGRGSVLDYYYEILNAKMDSSQAAELEIETRLFHDGAPVISDKTAPRSEPGAADPHRLQGAGRLTLARTLPPGIYVLQIIVTDKLAPGKFNSATQSVDFTIEP